MGATVDLLEYINSEIDKSNTVLAVFVDLRKAFDTINIQLLLENFYKIGCRGVCYNLLKSYSENRKHFTAINEAKIRYWHSPGFGLGAYRIYII